MVLRVPTPRTTRRRSTSTARYGCVPDVLPKFLTTLLLQDGSIDAFPVGFLNVYYGPGNEPEINLANVRDSSHPYRA